MEGFITCVKLHFKVKILQDYSFQELRNLNLSKTSFKVPHICFVFENVLGVMI